MDDHARAERQSVARRAWAKVNLALTVHPPVAEPPERHGWHPVESHLAPIDLFDDVEIQTGGRAGGEPGLVVEWAPDAPLPSPIDWPAEKDLAWRARLALERAAGRDLPCAIRIHKRIPTGSGLGGGSSDAAATLLALNDLCDLGLPLDRLREIGLTLGSDVAYFLDHQDPPRPAIVSGFGEHIERLPPLQGRLLLIIPPVHSSTPQVYRAFDASGRTTTFDAQAVRAAVAAGALAELPRHNDLARPALESSHDLHEFFSEITISAGEEPAITGSGSAMFYLAEELDPAAIVAVQAAAKGAGGAAFMASFK